MFRGKLLIAIATAKTAYNSQLLRCFKVWATECQFEDYETGAKLSLPNQAVQRFFRSARAQTSRRFKGGRWTRLGFTHKAQSLESDIWSWP